MKTLKAFIAATLFGSLAACDTTGTQSFSVADAVPISLDEMSALYAAANPGETSIPLKNAQGGFTIYENGDVLYNPRGADIDTWTTVVSNGGNEVCVDRAGRWSGACFTMLRNTNDSISVRYRFGNGRGGSLVSDPLNL